MEEFNQINDIIAESIKDTSYITVLISSGVYLAYTLIIKLVDLFKAKDRNRPIVEMAAAVKQVSENVVKLNGVLDKAFQDAETKERNKVKNAICTAFDSFKWAVANTCHEIIIHNNIEQNKVLIKQNLFKVTSTEYYKLYNVFSAYELDGICVATKLKEEWIDAVTNECLDIIYDGQDSINRISQISNKLLILTNEYSIYINNKVFNS
jgi:hypothetical protein|nr:MAG TPA: hypothetical protein [Crassvirales sp.]